MEWTSVLLGFIAVPLAAIAGTAGVIGLIVWLIYKSKMARLEFEEKQRQMELDEALLGSASKDLEANLDIILDRLAAIERRLDTLEGNSGVVDDKSVSEAGTEVTGSEERRRRSEMEDIGQDE